MSVPIVQTLLELGDATSENLEFAHLWHGKVSYNEETITECNLLELRRRHYPDTILDAISKGREATNGADWEWVIKGSQFSLFMRVQAKRTKRNRVLSIEHKVGASNTQQIDLLLKNSPPNFRPVYCFYTTESDRSIWNLKSAASAVRQFKYGCLLADARAVKAKPRIRKLSDVEDVCIPWHYLFDPRPLSLTTQSVSQIATGGFTSVTEFEPLISGASVVLEDDKTSTKDDDGTPPKEDYRFPTVDELNGYSGELPQMLGVRKTNDGEIEELRSRHRSSTDETQRFLLIDASKELQRI